MADALNDIYCSDLGTLEQLLDLRAPTDGSNTETTGPDLQHVLTAPLTEKLADTRPDWATALEDLCRQQDPPIRKVRDLLVHPSPPVGVLIILKNAAKASRKRPEGPLPDRAATALYLAAIGIAWYRRHELITSLGIEKLDEKLRWAAGEQWNDREIVAVLEAAAEAARTSCTPAAQKLPQDRPSNRTADNG